MEGNKTSIKTKLSQQISSLSLDKDELKKLLSLLQERASTAANHEIENFKKDQQTEEVYEANKKLLKDAFDLKVTVTGLNSQQLYGSIDEVFNSPNFPDDILSVYVNSDTLLRALYNIYPRNSFEILIDFSKPDILDFSINPSFRTPNASNFIVQGYETTWANGVFAEIESYLKSKKASLSLVHKNSVYDFLLWFMVLPYSFLICYKISRQIEMWFGDISVFVKNCAYMYVFILSIYLFRILFHYARWVFPNVEYRGKRNNSMLHRGILAAIGLSIISSILYDLIKKVFTGS